MSLPVPGYLPFTICITVVTPPLDGTILPGITCDSILAIAPSPSLPIQMKITVKECPLTLNELSSSAEEGRLVECFGAGTAVLIVGTEQIREVLKAGREVVTDAEAVGDVLDKQVGGIKHVGVNGKGTSSDTEGKMTPKIRDITMTTGCGFSPVGKALWNKLLALKEGREEWDGWNMLCRDSEGGG
ncbi:hypothetical protein B0H14DRAFT_2591523 [Mycena olivaceomarginata]|nr:hypothetical protein B0H14DRAFT_2591523 [Mycena olivaceomarginata]